MKFLKKVVIMALTLSLLGSIPVNPTVFATEADSDVEIISNSITFIPSPTLEGVGAMGGKNATSLKAYKKGANIGIREAFADVGATVSDSLGVKMPVIGKSFKGEIL